MYQLRFDPFVPSIRTKAYHTIQSIKLELNIRLKLKFNCDSYLARLFLKMLIKTDIFSQLSISFNCIKKTSLIPHLQYEIEITDNDDHKTGHFLDKQELPFWYLFCYWYFPQFNLFQKDIFRTRSFLFSHRLQLLSFLRCVILLSQYIISSQLL